MQRPIELKPLEACELRFEPDVVCDKKFLIWLGLGLFLFRLGARRQLDYELGGGPADPDPLRHMVAPRL